MGALPEEVILLQEEMNRAMEYLLMTRVSIDTHWRKQVSDFETAICQNEAKATEAIREVKAHYGAVIREVEAHHAMTIRKAEGCSSTAILEVEACCAADIERQNPTVWNIPAPSNNHILMVCSI